MLSLLLLGVCRHHPSSSPLPSQQVPPLPRPGLSLMRSSSAGQILQTAPQSLSHVPAPAEAAACLGFVSRDASFCPAQALKLEGDYGRFQS